MQTMLIFREPPETFAEREEPARAGAYWGAWTAYIAAMNEAGVVVSGAGLAPPAAGAVVRLRDGARDVEDGPYADSREQLGGFVVIETADLDEALVWAARSPAAAAGSVEVRPCMPSRS
jgi:hypothetical protein